MTLEGTPHSAAAVWFVVAGTFLPTSSYCAANATPVPDLTGAFALSAVSLDPTPYFGVLTASRRTSGPATHPYPYDPR